MSAIAFQQLNQAREPCPAQRAEGGGVGAADAVERAQRVRAQLPRALEQLAERLAPDASGFQPDEERRALRGVPARDRAAERQRVRARVGGLRVGAVLLRRAARVSENQGRLDRR